MLYLENGVVYSCPDQDIAPYIKHLLKGIEYVEGFNRLLKVPNLIIYKLDRPMSIVQMRQTQFFKSFKVKTIGEAVQELLEASQDKYLLLGEVTMNMQEVPDIFFFCWIIPFNDPIIRDFKLNQLLAS